MEDELIFLEMQDDLNILEKGEKLNILTNRRQKKWHTYSAQAQLSWLALVPILVS